LQAERGSAVAAFEVLVLVAAGMAFITVLALLVVIVGVHQEDRRGTLGAAAPTGPARLARRVLGTHYPLVSPRPAPLGTLRSLDGALLDDFQLVSTDA
jgi:hypothetical protein